MKTRLMPAFWSLAILALLLLPACAPGAGTAPDGSDASTMMSTLEPGGMIETQVESMPVTGDDLDAMFIDMMVPHHQGAVAMAEIALERSQRPELRELANAIIACQSDEINQMKDWRLQWYGSSDTPPMSEMPMLQPMPGMSGGHPMDMQADVDALQIAAEPFDLAFIDAMIPHHQSAIDAANLVLEVAVHPEIREMAAEVIAAQQSEIDQMTVWRQEWYPDAPPLETPSP